MAAAIALASPTAAFVPKAEKLAVAVAAANLRDKRTETLRLQVVLRPGAPVAAGPPSVDASSEVLAQGDLVSDPRGFARLELRRSFGRRERYLLRGGRVAGARGGSPVDAPAAYLPPFPLLQAASGDALRRGLIELGVAVDQAELGRSHGHDCYVIGGRSRSLGPDASGGGRASLWVDVDTYQIVGVERADGIRYRFGPLVEYSGLLVPAWIWPEVPGEEEPSHLEVRGATRVKVSPTAFTAGWLTPP